MLEKVNENDSMHYTYLTGVGDVLTDIFLYSHYLSAWYCIDDWREEKFCLGHSRELKIDITEHKSRQCFVDPTIRLIELMLLKIKVNAIVICYNDHNLISKENNAWKRFRPVWKLNPNLWGTIAMLYQLTQQAQTNESIVLHFSIGKVSEDGTLYLKITYGLYCRHPMALIKNQVIPITTQLNSPFRL